MIHADAFAKNPLSLSIGVSTALVKSFYLPTSALVVPKFLCTKSALLITY